jgi:hypothetical protein
VANLYGCDPSLELVVEGVIGNGHSGFIAVARPALGSVKERVKRSLGTAEPVRNTTVMVLASVTVRNAKRAMLTVDLYQIDAAGERVKLKTFSDSKPTAGFKKINLRVHVEVF